MKKGFVRIVTLFMCVVLMASMFTACGNEQEGESIDAVVDAAVKAALDAAVDPVVVTIEADGKQITVEDAASKSLQQMLDQAGITLNEGDMLSVPAYQTMSGNITVKVIRSYKVTVFVDGEEPVYYVLTLNGGTVADALAAAGIELREDQVTDLGMETALENAMVITVSAAEPQETEPEETEPQETKPTSVPTGSNTPAPTTPKATQPKPTEPKATEPKPTETTKPAKKVVSKVKYEDCDGSGHGVWIITYDDGSQEEVPF